MDVITRRGFLVGSAVLVAGGVRARADDIFATIEDRLGGRIGFSALDTHTGQRIRWRADERFAMCSTFKVALAAAVLARIDRRDLLPNHILNFDPTKLLGASRASAQHQDGRISVIEACEGVITVSDNTAANALLDLLGGPTVVTDFFRGLSDQVSRLDRYEMELNANADGDVRDTTTPDAMLHTLQALLLGNVLSDVSRGRLTEWMSNEQNGRSRARAGLPASWRVANKPGTSANGAVNDIGVAWPPQGQPIIFAVYTNAPRTNTAESEVAIAHAVASAAHGFNLK
jgi:beta-lactamase class A